MNDSCAWCGALATVVRTCDELGRRFVPMLAACDQCDADPACIRTFDGRPFRIDHRNGGKGEAK